MEWSHLQFGGICSLQTLKHSGLLPDLFSASLIYKQVFSLHTGKFHLPTPLLQNSLSPLGVGSISLSLQQLVIDIATAATQASFCFEVFSRLTFDTVYCLSMALPWKSGGKHAVHRSVRETRGHLLWHAREKEVGMLQLTCVSPTKGPLRSR